MQYSLLNRFRGTLGGAALGKTWRRPAGLAKPELPNPQGESPRRLLEEPAPGELPEVHRTTQLYAETLINFGDLNLTHLQRRVSTGGASSFLGALLPVILFFHEDEARLGQKICQISSLWSASLELQAGMLAVAYAIAQALREQLSPPTLIPHTVAYLRDVNVSLIHQLQQVQGLLEQGAGLDRTLKLLTHQPPEVQSINRSVALAFYCFLSTPEDFRLTLSRAVRTADQPQLAAMLA
ncbi:MAG TPA: ADP-ribosylglycohydrolase family protein, partial [Candidatus Caenarcaniphilales bacterium]